MVYQTYKLGCDGGCIPMVSMIGYISCQQPSHPLPHWHTADRIDFAHHLLMLAGSSCAAEQAAKAAEQAAGKGVEPAARQAAVEQAATELAAEKEHNKHQGQAAASQAAAGQAAAGQAAAGQAGQATAGQAVAGQAAVGQAAAGQAAAAAAAAPEQAPEQAVAEQAQNHCFFNFLSTFSSLPTNLSKTCRGWVLTGCI